VATTLPTVLNALNLVEAAKREEGRENDIGVDVLDVDRVAERPSKSSSSSPTR
jgi:hypothetical protein